LQVFAENAELETAMVVHRSGALVSGISSEEEVTVDVISALVAAASGAISALAVQLGETGDLESFHQGGERSLYFRSLADDFVLVGVSPARIPVGLIREGARRIADSLAGLVATLPAPPVASPQPEPESLEQAGVPAEVAPELGEPLAETVSQIPPTESEEEGPQEPELDEPEAANSVDAAEAATLVEPEDAVEPEPEPEEPRGIIEFLGGDDPEIVIEDEEGRIESPFEADEDEEESLDSFLSQEAGSEGAAEMPAPGESIFQAIEDEEEDVRSNVDEASVVEESAPAGGIFEIAEEDEVFEQVEEFTHEDREAEASGGEAAESTSYPGASEEFSSSLFEIDDEEEGEDATLDEEEGDVEDSKEEEVRSAGPFYL